MAYLGNDLQVAFPVYRNIDDISGSFNSSTTSFPLRVSGVAPVPAPLYSQQCLISVGGVVQRPDDSGSEGFRLSGGNIIFASAPTTGADFFGIILAGADYINAGGNFPSGTAAVPSITFNDDLDTGIYNSGINQVSITTGGSERLRIDSAGQIESVSLGTAAAPAFSFTTDPNTGIYSPGADQLAISTGGSGRLFVDASGNVGVGTATPETLFHIGSTVNNVFFDRNESAVGGPNAVFRKSRGIPASPTIVNAGDFLGALQFTGFDGSVYQQSAVVRGEADGAPSLGSVPGRLIFLTQSGGVTSERLRIDSSGRVGIGFAAPPERLSINDSNANAYVLVRSGIVNGDAAVKFNLNDVNYGGIGLENTALVMRCSNSSTPAERARIDSSGRLLVGTSSALGGINSTVQIAGTNAAAGLQITRFNSTDGCVVDFSSNRNATVNNYTTSVNGDELVRLRFLGYDGANQQVAAQITAYVDGTPGVNDMPGRLVFSTTADGASSPTERLRITSAGLVGVGTSSPGQQLSVTTASNDDGIILTNSSTNGGRLRLNSTGAGGRAYHIVSTANGSGAGGGKFAIFDNTASDAARLVIDSSGNIGINNTNPAYPLDVIGRIRGYSGSFALIASNGSGSGQTSISLTREGAPTDQKTWEILQGSAGDFTLRAINDAYNSAQDVFSVTRGSGLTIDNVRLFTSGNERLRIDSSGRLLVGTSSSRQISGNTAQIQLEGTDTNNSAFSITTNSNNNQCGYLVFGKSRGTAIGGTTVVQTDDFLGRIDFAGANGSNVTNIAAFIAAQVDGAVSGGGANDMPGRLVFYTTADGAASPTERMRITNDGQTYFGITGNTGLGTTNRGFLIRNELAGKTYVQLASTGTTTDTVFYFYNGNGLVGSISMNGSATAYNTSSDYRLKENVAPVPDGIARLQQLKPIRFNFIADPATTVDGFIAHEVQAVVPEAITGEKDAVDDQGNPQYQGIDQSKLVPLLTAALQEAIGEIESLKARVAALESA